MNDLVAFLWARYDEREAVAQAARHGASGRWRWMPDSRGAVEVGPEDADWPERATDGIVVYDEGSTTAEQTEHIALNDPAYVLADVAAKRRIVDSFAAAEQPLTTRTAEFAVVRMVLRLLALPFADHPDYREEWRS